MRESHQLFLACSIAIFGLAFAASTDCRAAEITTTNACAVLEGLSTLPLDPGTQGPGDCAAILQCRFEARQTAGLADEDGAGLTMEEACGRVGMVLSLTELQARKLADNVSDKGPPECRQFLTCVADSVARSGSAPESPLHEAAPDWKTEFDRICGQVPIAGSLTVEQLQQLIVDTGALITNLKESEIPQAKLFVQRLEMCRSFFEYSIDLRAGDAESQTED